MPPSELVEAATRDSFTIVNVPAAALRVLPTPIPGSVARGLALFCSPPLPEAASTPPHLGVDLLELPPGQSFPLHTHPGHHLLYVVRGHGTVTVGGQVYRTRPGELYLIDAKEPHAVGAGRFAHYLLSFGAPHVHLEDPVRMTVVGSSSEKPGNGVEP